ncbi:hypothetical protein OHB41_07140 [Streptomyces sp. NBC_01571]|uniref:hypothetical protein n=1 Tax=Streptomyces sp. NBC_01571 TaxID=2975883 RepID=UPI00225244FC|nr:hypothetical protein [Streptomyces sp. NBC_01571]MCX4572958.1 hypothetical protein [Streptomyces sp. NBC_01571]
MSWDASAGPAAAPADRAAARHRRALVQRELTRVREAAAAWRTGLAALLVGMVGFGLVKGRSDIRGLAAPYDVLVGCSLLAALATGAAGAFLLLRAAHGRPAATAVQQTPPGRLAWGEEALDHVETLRAARSLTTGVVLTVLCAVALTVAVAISWYGPDRSVPALEVVTPDGTFCGTSRGITDGGLRLRARTGEVTVHLDDVRTLRAVDSCAHRDDPDN